MAGVQGVVAWTPEEMIDSDPFIKSVVGSDE